MKASVAERLRWTAYLAWHWRGQSRFAFKSLASIEKRRDRRVRVMVRHAFDTVPWYRDSMSRLGLSPGQFRTAADLAKLPVVERADLQRDPDAFISAAVPENQRLRTRTGGSTGAPRTVWWDMAGILQNAAHAERERSMIAQAAGSFTNYRETVIGSPLSSDLDIQRIYSEKLFLPSRARVEYQHLSILDPPTKNVPLMNEFKPHVVRTYGSYLGDLFWYVRMSGVHFEAPRVVFYDADELLETARELITDHFGVEIISAYQAGEAFKIGFECTEHRGFHLNLDVYPVRIVDSEGHETPNGESGDVIVSNLVNRATVLLNYRLGDVAHLIPESCPCGRTLPLLSFVEGRTDDWIALPSGESMHPQSIRTILVLEPSVRQYQVVQLDYHRFTAAIVGADDPDAVSHRLRRRFAERFGPQTEVDISFVDAIVPAASGKICPVQSLVTRSTR